MSRKSLTITVKHQGSIRKVQTTTGVREELTEVIAKPVLQIMSETYEKTMIQSFYVVATFMQRVIARTPVDEEYEITLKSGKKKLHHPDEDVARFDWYVTDGSKTVMSKALIDLGAECTIVDNQSDIKKIAEYLISTFGLKPNKLTIGNANEHAGVLEYGGDINGQNSWSEGGEIKDGIGKYKRQHGVVNNHSVQAPVGMFRITLAELQEGIKMNDSMFKYMQPKNITNADVKRFAKILEQSGNIKIEDIKRILK